MMKEPVLTFADKYIECLSPLSFVFYVSLFAVIFLVFIYFETIEENVSKTKETVSVFIASRMFIIKHWMKLGHKLEPEIKIKIKTVADA